MKWLKMASPNTKRICFALVENFRLESPYNYFRRSTYGEEILHPISDSGPLFF